MRWRGVVAGWLSVAVVALASVGGAQAAACDEADPAAPARSARITLGPADLAGEDNDELRSFIVTGSLGRVDASIVSARPSNAVKAFVAGPETSRFSRESGEQLKGIAIVVTLRRPTRSAQVVVNLRQVCAHHFKDSFLYY